MNNIEKKFVESFPRIGEGDPALVEKILRVSSHMKIPARTVVKNRGDECADFVFLCVGEKRVFSQHNGGREITLYEMSAGDICILNASSILSNTPLPAFAETLTDSEVLLTPKHFFLQLIESDKFFRDFIFGRINQGFVSVVSLVNEVVFSSMGERLKDYLIEKSNQQRLLTTHQKIADDLGTSREVVTRLLSDLQRQGNILTKRNEIEILALDHVAGR